MQTSLKTFTIGALAAILGFVAGSYVSERHNSGLKARAELEYKMKGCVNVLMEMQFYEIYHPDQYSTGTSSRVYSGLTYVSTYRDMNLAFMSGHATSESPALILLSEEGSALRKKLTDDLESRLRNNTSLPCDENFVPNSFAPK